MTIIIASPTALSPLCEGACTRPCALSLELLCSLAIDALPADLNVGGVHQELGIGLRAAGRLKKPLATAKNLLSGRAEKKETIGKEGD